MSDATWRRHASPWSVWTRIPILPCIAAVLQAREALGPWAWAVVAALVVWAAVNPRAFPPPRTTRSWASRATFGERVWLNRGTVAILPGHARMAHLLSLIAALGLVPTIYGIVTLEPWATAFGVTLATGAKLWFCDRMVWLFEDMKDADPTYRSWLV